MINYYFFLYYLVWCTCKLAYLCYIHHQILSILFLLFFIPSSYMKWIKSASKMFHFEVKTLKNIPNYLINWIIVNHLVSLLFTSKLDNRKSFIRNTKVYNAYSFLLFPLLNKCLITLSFWSLFYNRDLSIWILKALYSK